MPAPPCCATTSTSSPGSCPATAPTAARCPTASPSPTSPRACSTQVDGPFLYAGDSVGGQVGLQLLLDAPDRVLGAVLCCTGAKIGDDAVLARPHRAGPRVRHRLAGERDPRSAGSRRASLEREPERASALLHALRDTSDEGYVAVCGALAAYDVRDRLGEIAAPVVAVAGARDPVCPPDMLREIADGVQHGRLVVLDDVAHQAPAEAPEEVADDHP